MTIDHEKRKEDVPILTHPPVLISDICAYLHMMPRLEFCRNVMMF